MTIPIETIQRKVSEVTQIPLDEMLSKGRKRERVIARQMSMYFAWKMTRERLETIGKKHGGLNHSTVIYSIKAIKDSLKINDPLIIADYEKILDYLKRFADVAPRGRPAPVPHRVKHNRKLLKLRAMIINHAPLETRKRVFERINAN